MASVEKYYNSDFSVIETVTLENQSFRGVETIPVTRDGNGIDEVKPLQRQVIVTIYDSLISANNSIKEKLLQAPARSAAHIYHPLIALFDYFKDRLDAPKKEAAIHSLEQANQALERSREEALKLVNKK